MIYLGGLAFRDVEERKIPVWCLGVGTMFSVSLFFYHIFTDTVSLATALLGMVPGILLLGISVITGCVGLGDGIILMILGLYLGLHKIFLLFCISIVLMGFCSGILFVTKRVRGSDKIPYLPFLCMTYAGWYISSFVSLAA